jgi:hypothetical protein
MLAQALAVCQQLGLREVLVTRAVDNLGSRRVIEANGGALARIVDGEVHYWLPTSQRDTPSQDRRGEDECRMKLRSAR